jgi:phosphate transport system substrate-binding protein
VTRWVSGITIACVATIVACNGSSDKQTRDSAAPAAAGQSSGTALTGAGATFPYPLYSKWFSEYAAKTGVKINYQPIGSGGGIQQLSQQTVDFGASDAPMTDSEMVKAKGGPIMHIPMTLGVVAIAYNLPGLTQPLRLTGSLVADLFLGTITKWNDPRIAAVNPGVTLPASDVLVVHRTDGSGTTFIFSDYLSSVSPAWMRGPGKGKQLQWPVGLGGKGNEGVAGQLKQSAGAIGYVELAYAVQNKMATAVLKNADGQFVAPSPEGATAAAAGAIAKLPPTSDYRVSIVNAPGAAAYPIASFTWLLVYRNPPDAAKAKILSTFVHWALTEGQNDAASLAYAPLPPALVSRLMPRVDSIAPGGTK